MNYTTAGEAGGQALIALVDAVPAGLRLETVQVESDVKRCVAGLGFSESVSAYQYVDISSGIFDGRTTGAPVTFLVYGDEPVGEGVLDQGMFPCPGRGDLPAMLYTAADDVASVVPRLAAFDQIATVAAASVPREFLAELGVDVRSYVAQIGSVALNEPDLAAAALTYQPLDVELSAVRCPVPRTSDQMVAALEAAQRGGETLGGVFRLVVTGLVPGLGAVGQRSGRLTAALAAALFSLPDVVGVEFGGGFSAAGKSAAASHDGITVVSGQGFMRSGNVAGGLDGAMTTGQPLIISVAVAAPSEGSAALTTVNLGTLQSCSNVASSCATCRVPGIAVAAEAEIAFALATAYTSQFGGSNMTDIRGAVDSYRQRLRRAAR